MNPRNLYQLLEQASIRYGDAAALHQPIAGGGRREYRTCSWKQYREIVAEIAAGLRGLGVQRGDVVAIECDTRMEFYLVDFGIMASGGVAAALYTSYPAPELVKTIRGCGARVAFVEDPAKLEAVREAPVEQWILIDGEAPGAIPLDELRALAHVCAFFRPLVRNTLKIQERIPDFEKV
jgi:long-subunit acyl-CoA synthetase (AMP-forming)